ncbi:hypothetical protein BB934_13820 [Microvirga ossetica]|uniref:Uncharacterized protein n=1 Tax=Microvirga ossetica TaxID=1882682 RepID=A0A1B2EGR3_9HYPH|nr:hypothetical protein [Microvirga ossetica]ANY79158.1 hypothetical protein BB934_13820 [Microvirga ossetica]
MTIRVGPLGVVADSWTNGCGIRCEIPHQARPVTAAARPIQSEFGRWDGKTTGALGSGVAHLADAEAAALR